MNNRDLEKHDIRTVSEFLGIDYTVPVIKNRESSFMEKMTYIADTSRLTEDATTEKVPAILNTLHSRVRQKPPHEVMSEFYGVTGGNILDGSDVNRAIENNIKAIKVSTTRPGTYWNEDPKYVQKKEFLDVVEDMELIFSYLSNNRNSFAKAYRENNEVLMDVYSTFAFLLFNISSIIVNSARFSAGDDNDIVLEYSLSLHDGSATAYQFQSLSATAQRIKNRTLDKMIDSAVDYEQRVLIQNESASMFINILGKAASSAWSNRWIRYGAIAGIGALLIYLFAKDLTIMMIQKRQNKVEYLRQSAEFLEMNAYSLNPHTQRGAILHQLDSAAKFNKTADKLDLRNRSNDRRVISDIQKDNNNIRQVAKNHGEIGLL